MAEQTLPEYIAQIAVLRDEHKDNPDSLALLDALDQWRHSLQDTP